MADNKPYTLDAVANICATLQASHAEVTKAIEAVNARPAVTFNGTNLFDGPTTESICEAVREARATKETK